MKYGSAEYDLKVNRFTFDTEICRNCPQYDDCVNCKHRWDRPLTLHPDEKLFQEARALEKTEYFRYTYRERVVMEHRRGRLVRLGVRQSRFFAQKRRTFRTGCPPQCPVSRSWLTGRPQMVLATFRGILAPVSSLTAGCKPTTAQKRPIKLLPKLRASTPAV